MCNYLWVVHEPHQASLLGVQYEVTTQELAAALILLDVQEATDAVLSVHIRHLDTRTFPGLLRPAGRGGGVARASGSGRNSLQDAERNKEEKEMCGAGKRK